jgi:hypothetical protein
LLWGDEGEEHMTKKSLREICEEKARAGDGAFAIAAALFDLSDSQEATAKSLQNLGNGNASTDFGAIEGLAMQVIKLADAVENAGSNISSSISHLDLNN